MTTTMTSEDRGGARPEEAEPRGSMRPGPVSRAASWRWYHRVTRIRDLAAKDVGRGSEVLMTFSRRDLFHAARLFATGAARRALVVTGFYIPGASSPAAESDGPVGAVEIASALRAMGGDAWLVSDEWCAPVVSAAAAGDVPDDHVLISPAGAGFDEWLASVGRLVRERGIDSLVYIERVGPSRDGDPRNMRGVNISRWTAPLSRLTELGLRTIGVGDGGNEIGMGRIDSLPIEDVVDHGERIACTVPTERLIISGTSNWGGHALVCSMRVMGHPELDPLLGDSWHRGVLRRVADAGGLDGVTMLNTPTVDGLSEERYYEEIRALSGLAR